MMEHELRRWQATSCAGKVPHLSRREALLTTKYHHATPVTAYHCRFCGYWHLGGTHTKRGTKQSKTLLSQQKRGRS